MRATGISAAIAEVLSDGKWHIVGEVVAALNTIPPEVAYRHYTRTHTAKAPTAKTVRRGRELLTVRYLRDFARHHEIEREYENRRLVKVRLQPKREVGNETAAALDALADL